MNVATILKLKGKEVFTTTPETTLLDITKLLGLHGIGCIVITGSEGNVIGIVSERDIVREIARVGSKVLKEPVETCMTKAVVTCRESDTIDRLMAEMTAHRFRHMPVVERGRLIGLIRGDSKMSQASAPTPKLHHVNLKTRRLDEMIAWYGAFSTGSA